LGLQLVVMLAFSSLEYSRFALTKDFAAYTQAMWAISHGHLDPFSTVIGVSLWRNNAEFILWPLALFYRAYPHPILLLWVQDVVVVAAELVAFRWVLDLLRRQRGQIATSVARASALGLVLALVLDPWAYETIAFDFHSHVFAALFVVLAGRDLWAGRTRRLWLWVCLAVVSDAPGALCVAGLGVTGLIAGRRTRVQGAVLASVGAGWFLFVTTIGGDGVGGGGLGSWYGYLVESHHGKIGIFAVLYGALLHPQLMWHMVAARWVVIVGFLVAVGLVGVLSPWGFGVALFVFVPTVLSSNPNFARFESSFQFWPSLPFLLVGSMMVIMWLCAQGRVACRAATASAIVWAAATTTAAFAVLPTIPHDWIAVDSAAAAQLSRVQAETPPRAEVVASNGLVGRFAQRDYVYVLGYQSVDVIAGPGDMTVPVKASSVVFVISTSQGVGDQLALYERAVSFLRDDLRARVLVARAGIYAFEWRPPPGTARITVG
jgi:uncharacterized membrane protein